jgi:hypothetical protein
MLIRGPGDTDAGRVPRRGHSRRHGGRPGSGHPQVSRRRSDAKLARSRNERPVEVPYTALRLPDSSSGRAASDRGRAEGRARTDRYLVLQRKRVVAHRLAAATVGGRRSMCPVLVRSDHTTASSPLRVDGGPGSARRGLGVQGSGVSRQPELCHLPASFVRSFRQPMHGYPRGVGPNERLGLGGSGGVLQGWGEPGAPGPSIGPATASVPMQCGCSLVRPGKQREKEGTR